MKPVRVKGVFNHTSEIHISRQKNGEKGVDIVVPFYTHLNDKGEECGILVNRGWVPHDLKTFKMHLYGAQQSHVTGILYRGDNKTKYSKPNEPFTNMYYRSDPADLALITQLKNFDEASQFML